MINRRNGGSKRIVKGILLLVLIPFLQHSTAQTGNILKGIATVYKNCNDISSSIEFGVGDYKASQLDSLGLNNVISAIRVGEGFKAILYGTDDFTGPSLEITNDSLCLTDWNDQISSIRVITNGIPTLSGTFYIQNRHSNLVMNVAGGPDSISDEIALVQYGINHGTNQQFEFTHLGDGTYKITAVNSGKVIDVYGANMYEGEFAMQFAYHGGYNQQFVVVPTEYGFYKLIANTAENC